MNTYNISLPDSSDTPTLAYVSTTAAKAKEEEDTANDAKAREGYCPKCEAQILWARKPFHMGILAFYDSCPKCLPTILPYLACEQATVRIETLQQEIEQLTLVSRDVQRIQTELQFMAMEIEGTRSTQNLDSGTYNILISKAARALEENMETVMDCWCATNSLTNESSPTIMEQITALGADMTLLTDQIKQQQQEYCEEKSVSGWHPYALRNVLLQLEEVHREIEQHDESLFKIQEFQEMNQLESKLEHTKHVITNIKEAISTDLLHDVNVLIERMVSNKTATISSESEQLLRKQMEEMERQHKEQLASLQAQLDAIMYNTVATDAVAVQATTNEETVGGIAPALPSTVVEAEVILDTNRHVHRTGSIITVEAEVVLPLPNGTTNGNVASAPNRQVVQQVSSNNRQEEEAPIEFVDQSDASAGNTVSNHSEHAADRQDVPTSASDELNTPNDCPEDHQSETEALASLEPTFDMPTIIRMMEEYPRSVRVQTMACEKLALLTSNDSIEHVAIAVIAGAIPLVLAAMRQFRNDKELQVQSLLVICRFTNSCIENRSTIGGTGGVDLVLAALRCFPKDAKTQIYGSSALGNLAFGNSVNSVLIGSLGGPDLVQKALLQFPRDVDVQRCGLYAVGNMAFGNEQSKAELGAVHGITLIANGMKHFPHDEGVQRNGITALGNIASTHAESRALICDTRCYSLVLKAMRQFPLDARIQDRGCKAIRHFAKSLKLKHKMKAEGAIKLVRRAKKVIPDKQSVEVTIRALHGR